MTTKELFQTEENRDVNESSNSKEFITGAIVGGLAGALAALLFAPKSGKEMRGTLNEQKTVLMGKTDRFRESAMVKGSELAAVAKDKANTLKETVSQQSSTFVNKVKDMRNQQGSEPSESMEDSIVSEGEFNETSTPVGETYDTENFETAKGDEIQQKLEETQKAFDETESKLNQ